MTTASPPRARTARAAEAPAIPAPTMATRRGGMSCAWPGRRASSRSRLRPKPGRLSTAKPAAVSPRRTWPATVNVAARAPGAERAATRARTAWVHIPGFRAGANPSRNQASARPLQPSSAGSTSMTARSRMAPNSGNSTRCTPRARPGQRAIIGSTTGASSGHRARARDASAAAIGNASMEKMWSTPCAFRVRRQRSRSAATFSPVPKPSSPTTKRRRCAQASGRPQPSRNTARVSARPS